MSWMSGVPSMSHSNYLTLKNGEWGRMVNTGKSGPGGREQAWQEYQLPTAMGMQASWPVGASPTYSTQQGSFGPSFYPSQPGGGMSNLLAQLLGGAGGGGGGAWGAGGGGMQGGGVNYMNTLLGSQKNILGQGSNLVSGLLAGKTPQGYHPFGPFTPQQTSDLYAKYFNPAEQAKLENETLPGIREAFVGPGTYWSGARASAESDARTGLLNQQMDRIGQMYLQSKQQAMQSLLPFALGLAGLETGVTYGTPGQWGGGGGGFNINSLLKQLLGGGGGAGAAPQQMPGGVNPGELLFDQQMASQFPDTAEDLGFHVQFGNMGGFQMPLGAFVGSPQFPQSSQQGPDPALLLKSLGF